MKPEAYRPKEIKDMNEDELRRGIDAVKGMISETQEENDRHVDVLRRPDRSTIHPRMAERVQTSTEGERGFAYTTKEENEQIIIAQKRRLAEYEAALAKLLAKK
jgi:hypothetical protein